MKEITLEEFANLYELLLDVCQTEEAKSLTITSGTHPTQGHVTVIIAHGASSGVILD
ncbi:MAG: hypothetical protein AB2793_00140 [Candidatus Thiodiazotropha sp.]